MYKFKLVKRFDLKSIYFKYHSPQLKNSRKLKSYNLFLFEIIKKNIEIQNNFRIYLVKIKQINEIRSRKH